MKMKNFILIIALIFLTVLVSGCVQSASTEMNPGPAIQEESVIDQPAVDSNQSAPNPFQNTGKKCANYKRDGVATEYCATCGDGLCESMETCHSSAINCTSPLDCMKTDDCGLLYCPQDCK